jgi:hypothetical protein
MLALDELRELIEGKGPSSVLGLLRAQRVRSPFALDELKECLEGKASETSAQGLFALAALKHLTRPNIKAVADTWTRYTIDLSLIRQQRKIQASCAKGAGLSRQGKAAAEGLLAPCVAALTHLVFTTADLTVRKAATSALGLFTGTTPVLEELLLNEELAASAERALAKSATDEAATILWKRYESSRSLHCLHSLSQIPSVYVTDHLKKVCKSGEPAPSLAIAANLGKFPGELAKPLLNILLASSLDDIVNVALWSIQEDTKEILFELLPKLWNVDDIERSLFLLDTLGRVGREEHIEIVVTHLDSSDIHCRRFALDALVNLGPGRDVLVEHLLPLTTVSDVRLRLRALLALAPIADSIDIQPLKVLVQNSEQNLKIYVARYLGYVQSPTALKLLEHLFRLNDASVKVQVLHSLANYPKEERARCLQLARDSNVPAVQRALRTLGFTGEGDELDEALAKWRMGACSEAALILEKYLSREKPSAKAFHILEAMVELVGDCANSEGEDCLLWAELERRGPLLLQSV